MSSIRPLPQLRAWQRPASADLPVATESPDPSDQVSLGEATSEPPPGSLEAEFREAFFRDYEARKCGQNIRRFLTRVEDKGMLDGAKVLGIENKGFSYFGLVRAMHTRDTNNRGEMRVTDHNWYHHVVLEKDGRIFDFDFGITPTVANSEEYFETMFFECDKVPRERKLDDYQVQVIDAREYLEGDRDTSQSFSFRDYGALQGWSSLARHEVRSR